MNLGESLLHLQNIYISFRTFLSGRLRTFWCKIKTDFPHVLDQRSLPNILIGLCGQCRFRIQSINDQRIKQAHTHIYNIIHLCTRPVYSIPFNSTRHKCCVGTDVYFGAGYTTTMHLSSPNAALARSGRTFEMLKATDNIFDWSRYVLVSTCIQFSCMQDGYDESLRLLSDDL